MDYFAHTEIRRLIVSGIPNAIHRAKNQRQHVRHQSTYLISILISIASNHHRALVGRCAYQKNRPTLMTQYTCPQPLMQMMSHLDQYHPLISSKFRFSTNDCIRSNNTIYEIELWLTNCFYI